LIFEPIDYTNQPQPLKLNYANFSKSFQVKSLKPYITTSSVSENMKATKQVYGSNIVLPPRSIVTIVNKLSNVMTDPSIPVINKINFMTIAVLILICNSIKASKY
jgi:hypothetical protein